MTGFREIYPSIDLTLYTGSREGIKNMILKGKIEIAVATNPVSSPALEMEPFRGETLVAFVPSRHPLAQKTITSAELARLPLVLRITKHGRTNTEELLNTACGSGNYPTISMRCESPEAVKAAVKMGAGVGVLYHDIVAPEVKRGEFVLLKLAGIYLRSWSYILYSNAKPLSSTAQTFLAYLRASRPKPRSSQHPNI